MTRYGHVSVGDQRGRRGCLAGLHGKGAYIQLEPKPMGVPKENQIQPTPRSESSQYGQEYTSTETPDSGERNRA